MPLGGVLGNEVFGGVYILRGNAVVSLLLSKRGRCAIGLLRTFEFSRARRDPIVGANSVRSFALHRLKTSVPRRRIGSYLPFRFVT